MKSIDLTTAIGLLLSDPRRLKAFRADARALAGRLEVGEQHLRAFVGLDPASLERQAECLLMKRFRAVERFMPVTMAHLGDEALELFRFYAVSYWPKGHRRHLLDAQGFTRFLMRNRIEAVCRMELNGVRFQAGGGLFRIQFFPLGMPCTGRWPSVHVLFRRDGQSVQRACTLDPTRLLRRRERRCDSTCRSERLDDSAVWVIQEDD